MSGRGWGAARVVEPPSRAGRRLRCAILATPIVAATASFHTEARAANLFWDGDGQGVVAGGSGSWDTVLPRWSATSSGSTYAPFSASADANFAGAGGVVFLPAAIAANSLHVTGGNYVFVGPAGGSSPITLTAGTFDTGGQTVHLIEPIAGGAGLNKLGAGTLAFDGAHTYSGATTINAGTLALSNPAGGLPDASAVTIAAGATLDLAYTGGFVSDTVGSIAGAGTINFAAATFAGYAADITGSALIVGGDNSTTTFSGNLLGGGVSGGGSLQKDGSGTVTLAGNNTFAGGLRITGGAVTLATSNALAAACPVVLSGSGTLNIQTPTTLGGLGTASGAQVVNNNGNALTVGSSTFNFQANGVITGAGAVIKTGSGVQQLTSTGAASSYSGGTIIRGGVLAVAGDAKLGATAGGAGGVTLDGGTLSNVAAASTSATTYSSNRAFTLNATAAAGGAAGAAGFQVLHSNASFALTTMTLGPTAGGGKISGTGALAKSGPGALVLLNGGNDYSGGTVINEGVIELQSGSANATPLGTGQIDIRRGRLFVHPAVTGAGGSITVRAAATAGATITYAAGSEIKLERNFTPSAWNVMRFDAGPVGAAVDSVLTRAPGGTLVLIPHTIGSLGDASAAEQFLVEGGVSSKNGIVSPSILGISATQSIADFLGYGATGFTAASYSTNNINTSTAASVTFVSSPQTLTANRAAYALKTGGTIDGGGGAFGLSIGDGTGPATLIMTVGSSIATAALTFNGTDAIIYAQRTTGSNGVQTPLLIDAPLSVTGNGGLTKIGTGFVQLNAAAAYAGATRIAQGGIQLGVNDALPIGTDVVMTGAVPEFASVFALEQSTLKLGAFNQTVNSLASENQYALVDLSTGTLTVSQSTTTTFRGTFLGADGSGGGSGTLLKSGSGTLVLNPFNGGVFSNISGPFVSTYGKLKITGGTVAVSSFNSLPANPAAMTADTITLDNSAILRFDFAPIYAGAIDADSGVMSFSSDTTGPGGNAIVPNRGVTLGAGGGTISVTDPRATIVWQRGNGETVGVDDRSLFNGSGDLVKDGAGTLRLGIGNLNSGRVIVKAGTLQFQNESALGDLSGVGFRADGLKLDGGVAQSVGSGVLAANRGVTVTANGGALKGTFVINAPIVGGGTLEQIRVDRMTASSVTLNAASPLFSGTLHLTDGLTNFAVSGAGGTGTIDVDPLFPVTLAKTSGAADTVLGNPITLGGGGAGGASIAVRVDGGVGNLVFNGKVSGAADVFKNSPGTLVLANAANDFTGRLIIQGGSVVATASGALGGVSGETVVTSGGTLGFDGNVNYTAGELVTLAGGGGLRNVSGANSFAGVVALGGDGSADVSSGSLNLTTGVAGAATLTKTGAATLEVKNLRVSGLNVNAGKVKLTPDPSAAGVSAVGALSIAGGAALDLGANKFVTTTPAGTWTGSNYTGVSALLRSGRNGGNWSGSGIVTSQTAATAGILASIGVATAKQVKGLSGASDTALWAGQTVTGTDTLVMYTYGGDANLDGKINISDYGRIDFNIPLGVAGWFNGDFNYDGKIDISDYGIIDFNIGIQSSPFFAASQASTTAAPVGSAVPEPAALAVMGAAALGLVPGRRRRRARSGAARPMPRCP